MSNKSVEFTQDTGEPGNRYRNSTTTPSPGLYSNGAVHPGTKAYRGTNQNTTPKGSYDEATERFTGDFRGLGVTNPWGGKKSLRRPRRSRRRRH